MGCISSKSSNDEQTDSHEIDPIHRSSNDASALILPKHDDMLLSVEVENREQIEEKRLIVERCSSFHTVEEYDEMLQRIKSSKDDDDGEVVGVPVPVQDADSDQPITDSAGKKDGDDESGIKENKTENIEFQTVASLRQWLHSPRDADAKVKANANANTDAEYTTPKFAFGFYDNDTETPVENLVLVEPGKKQEDETILELVVAFDQYMQQLQIDEDNILKHIHNIID